MEKNKAKLAIQPGLINLKRSTSRHFKRPDGQIRQVSTKKNPNVVYSALMWFLVLPNTEQSSAILSLRFAISSISGSTPKSNSSSFPAHGEIQQNKPSVPSHKICYCRLTGRFARWCSVIDVDVLVSSWVEDVSHGGSPNCTTVAVVLIWGLAKRD